MKRYMLLLLLGVTANAACVPPPNTYEYEADQWRDRVTAASGTLSANAYRAGTMFLKQTKWWGVRPYLGRSNLYVGDSTNAMRVPIVGDWFTGSLSPDSLQAFVAGDFAESTGLTGNGTTKYIIPNGNGAGSLKLTGITVPTNLHFAIYVRTASAEASFAIGFQNAAAPRFYITAGPHADNGTYGGFGADGNHVGIADTNGVGGYMVTRRSTTEIVLAKNGATVSTNTTSDTSSFPNLAVFVHAVDTDNTPDAFVAKTMSYYGIGFAIPNAQVKPYYDAVQNVQIRMGRQK